MSAFQNADSSFYPDPLSPRSGDRVTITVSGRVTEVYPGHLSVLLDGGGSQTMFLTEELPAGSIVVHPQPLGAGDRVIRNDVPPDTLLYPGTILAMSEGRRLAMVGWDGSDSDVSVHAPTDLRRAA